MIFTLMWKIYVLNTEYFSKHSQNFSFGDLMRDIDPVENEMPLDCFNSFIFVYL